MEFVVLGCTHAPSRPLARAAHRGQARVPLDRPLNTWRVCARVPRCRYLPGRLDPAEIQGLLAAVDHRGLPEALTRAAGALQQATRCPACDAPLVGGVDQLAARSSGGGGEQTAPADKQTAPANEQTAPADEQTAPADATAGAAAGARSPEAGAARSRPTTPGRSSGPTARARRDSTKKRLPTLPPAPSRKTDALD